MVARLLVENVSLHVDNERGHDRAVGLFVGAMNGAGAAARAWCGPMKHQWPRDGVTTEEQVLLVIKHDDGHFERTHYDDLIAASSQEGLSSLNSSLESNLRTKQHRQVLSHEGGVR